MKNDTTFMHMRNGGHLGDAKNVEKYNSLRRISVSTNRNRQKRFSQNEQKRTDLQNNASKF